MYQVSPKLIYGKYFNQIQQSYPRIICFTREENAQEQITNERDFILIVIKIQYKVLVKEHIYQCKKNNIDEIEKSGIDIPIYGNLGYEKAFQVKRKDELYNK